MPIVNQASLEWDETERGETHFRRKALSTAASEGDPGLGCSLYELPPGGKSWPYHYHMANAEAILVRAGAGTLRLAGERHPLEAGDYVTLPVGPDGGHRVVNDGDEPLRYLVLSTMAEPEVTVYPDSEKFGVYAGAPPGGREERHLDGYYRLDDDVSYWEGE